MLLMSEFNEVDHQIYVKRRSNHTPEGLKWSENKSDKVELSMWIATVEAIKLLMSNLPTGNFIYNAQLNLYVI